MDMLKLLVYYDIRSREIGIRFPATYLASAYYRLLSNEQARIVDRDVYLKLPSSVSQLQATLSYDGIIFNFDDPDKAARWKDTIRLQVPGNRRQVYIKRNWAKNDLDRALGIAVSQGTRSGGVVGRPGGDNVVRVRGVRWDKFFK